MWSFAEYILRCKEQPSSMKHFVSFPFKSDYGAFISSQQAPLL